MGKDGRVSLMARGGVVAARPLLLLLIANYNEMLASDVARLLFWSVFLTSAASMSVYKNYMEEALKYGLSSIYSKIIVHSWYYIIFLTLISAASNTWLLAVPLTLDFFLHQVSRVLLYQKRFISWASLNLLSLFVVTSAYIFLKEFQEAVCFLAGLLGAIVFIALYLLYLRAKFTLEMNWSEAFFGTSRKFFFSADKLILTVMLEGEDFWILAIMFQLSNIALTAFDATVIAPKKREIVLDQINYWAVKVFLPCSILAMVSGVTCASFYLYSTQSIYHATGFLFCFFLRSASACFLSLILEFYFWRKSVGKISVIMLVVSAIIFGSSFLLSRVLESSAGIAFALVFLQSLSMALLFYYADTQLRGERHV